MTSRPSIKSVLEAQAKRGELDRAVTLCFRVPWGANGYIEEAVLREWIADQITRAICSPMTQEQVSEHVGDSSAGGING